MALPNPQTNQPVMPYDQSQTAQINANQTQIEVNRVAIGTPSLVGSILYRLGLIADYVIEYGSNDNGNYEKWASGKLKQWGFGQMSHPAINLYYDRTINFPVPFIDSKCSLQCNGYLIETQGDLGVTANTATYFKISSKRKDATYDTRYGWESIGRWKV